MIFLLMAAHDTSTITVTTMMRQLGAHPEWRDRLREEAAHLPDSPDPRPARRAGRPSTW